MFVYILTIYFFLFIVFHSLLFLILLVLLPLQSGNYTCRLWNSVGSDSVYYYLDIRGNHL